MKKIIFFIFTFLLILTLISCNNEKQSETNDSDFSYYVTSTNDKWTANENNKLKLVSLDDLELEGLTLKQSDVNFAYQGKVKLDENASYNILHNSHPVNGGLTFEIVKTNTPDDFSSYNKLTSRGDLYESLTENTLYSSDTEHTYNGAVAKISGTFTVIFVEFKSLDSMYKYGIGLYALDLDEDEPSKNIPGEGHTCEFTGEWKKDETHHWHECECGKTDEKVAHSGGEATTTEKAKCEVCGQSYGDFASENIDLSNVKFKNKTFTYDGEVKSLEIENLPTGCSVEYENNNQTDVGLYSVTAIVKDEKGNVLETYEAFLTIEEAQNDPGNDDPNPDDPEDTEKLSYDGADILPDGYKLADNTQDGLILHAWNWSYKNIEDNLATIAKSGYTTVQVSPVQQPKDYDPTYPKGWAEQWWKFYQPLSFSIAKNSWLGTKAELTSLCAAADKYGIKIIADIVANHVANVSDTGTTNQSTPHKTVKDYEPELYAGSYFRSFITNNDSSIEAVVRGAIGMPDLKTETSFVQNMVIDLLKECIDCGIDGFRFDAAKHIETPDDGSYKSDFWPTVLNAADTYATSKKVTLYYYGEILNTPGNGRNWASYTKMMAITDNKTGDDIRKAVVSHNASSAASSSYKTGQDAKKLVLWAESHDTYANDSQESTNVSQSDINKTWALVASRKDATALYFARPGEVGSIGTYDWMSLEVSAVNNFHNSFIGANESLYSQDKYAIVERYNNEKSGMVIVNCNGTNATVSINSKNMKDGTYIDQVTGNEFMVASGKVTGNIGSSGIAVLTQESGNKAPVAQLSQEGGYFSNTLNVSIDLSFATSARVRIGTKEQIITKDTSISIGENMKNGESVTVEVSVINDKYRQTKTYEFTKLNGITANSVVVSNVPTNYTSGTNYDVYAYLWKNGSQGGEFVKTTLNGSYVVFEMKGQYDSFLLLTVAKGNEPAWNLKVKQTSDFKFVKGAIYEAPKEAWS